MRCLCIILFCLLTYQYLSAQEKIIGYKADIEPYVSFINEQQLSPVTYLLRKYQTHDVIVLGERDHRDLTQYYFIEKLLNTEEFYKKVGVIYTEVGSSNFNDTLNKVLKNLTLSEDEIYRRLLGIYREISYEAFWDKYNFFYLWKTLYHFNHVHPDYPITLMMTSYPFHWNEIRDTIQCRAKTNEVEKNYDRFMAEYFLKRFTENPDSQRKKALVIMNYPHSLRRWTSQKMVTHTDFFGAYINAKLSERVCYIIINPYTLNIQPVVGGKWDAALKYCKELTVGFDFKGSPFGKDTFDVWPLNKGINHFEDLYDGIIFINPAYSCENVIGVPGFLDRRFSKEYIRRLKLRMYIFNGKEFKTKLKWEKGYCNQKRTILLSDEIKSRYGDDASKNYYFLVNRWLLIE